MIRLLAVEPLWYQIIRDIPLVAFVGLLLLIVYRLVKYITRDNDKPGKK